MRLTYLAAAALVLGLAACSPAGKTEVKAPDSVNRMQRSEVEAIVKDYLINNPEVLAQAFGELQRREEVKTFTRLINEKDDPSIGPANAPITIVEFFDYNCGYCKAANPWVFEQLASKKNDVRVIFKEYPVLAESSHYASTAALAAAKQGKYREMHLTMMKSHDFSPENVDKMAASVGLDLDRMHKDMKSEEVADHITRVLTEGQQADVKGTPGFFVNGVFLNGYNQEQLQQMVDDERAKAKKG
jgi:protein-disulfide isomerase